MGHDNTGEGTAQMQLLQQIEQPFRVGRVEVSRGLVGEQELGLEPTSARATAPRCCSPPESSSGKWLTPVIEAHRCDQLARRLERGAAGAAGDQQGHRDVFLERELGQQGVELKHEPDASGCATALAAPPRAAATSLPKSTSCPASGRSSSPIRWSSVLLPTPEGPTTASISPPATVEVDPAQHLDAALAGAVALPQAGGADHLTHRSSRTRSRHQALTHSAALPMGRAARRRGPAPARPAARQRARPPARRQPHRRSPGTARARR